MALGALAAVALAACNTDELLDVEDPSVATPGTIRDPSVLPSVVAGALGDFQVAYVGSSGIEGQILTSGLLADEFLHSGTFPTRLEVDRRSIQFTNATMQDVFRNLARARSSAERAAALVEELGGEPEAQAFALNLAGNSYILFAENYCSGVPFAEASLEGQFTYGPALPRDSILNRAIARFNEVMALTDSGSTQFYIAKIGKARALLDMGMFAEAAQAAAGVPTDFEFNLESSANTGRQNNGVFVFNWLVGRWTVIGNEGINGLPFLADSLDPRVPSTRAETGSGAPRFGFDGDTPLFGQLKYPTREAATPLATGIEARLIEAEAALQADNFIAMYAILNDLRDDVGLAPLVVQTTEAAAVDDLFKERAYWLWLTAHRLGDLRRLIYQYGRLEDNVFPTGTYVRTGGTYGDDVAFPVPVDEANNPEFDRSQCVTTDA